ncbi:SAM-dependent methyltransferase [uncultured Bacteroides sp.]|uniref:THUMP-like domain-containing protein n=1 Tax=uncultured Bacteroides sp. TaxID=162156 RepID=UPI00260959D7|nr:SAM-dependent methyltransferase [uncultured Bacteroides sp.]
MELNNDILRFIREHSKDDVRTLALQAPKYPGVDMPAALTQIAGRQAAAEKIPSWHKVEELVYPRHLSLEQCSSEATARYKASLIPALPAGTLTDLTGGFGIDCAFLSSKFQQATYVERQEELCEIAAHNFPQLGLTHIRIENTDSVRHLQEMSPVDWIFIDPARRDGHGGKTVAIADCEPDVSALETLLLAKAQHVMVKLSPMLDLSLALQELKHVQEAHIVSVNNECKELLLILGHADLAPEEIPIHCVNLQAKGGRCMPDGQPAFCFTRAQEQASASIYADIPGKYLYEPNASLLKAGAFRSIARIYRVEKLHPNSHLYTSELPVEGFPGRCFQIAGLCTLNKKEMKATLGNTKKANITVRNFPASVAELRKRLKLAEGGDVYLFATTLGNEQKVIIKCNKVSF